MIYDDSETTEQIQLAEMSAASFQNGSFKVWKQLEVAIFLYTGLNVWKMSFKIIIFQFVILSVEFIDWPKLTKLLTGQLLHVAHCGRHEKLWVLIILTTITQLWSTCMHLKRLRLRRQERDNTRPRWRLLNGDNLPPPVKEEGSPRHRKSGRGSKIRWEDVTRSNAPSPPLQKDVDSFLSMEWRKEEQQLFLFMLWYTARHRNQNPTNQLVAKGIQFDVIHYSYCLNSPRQRNIPSTDNYR